MSTNQNRCVCTIQYRYGGESTTDFFQNKGLSMMRREGWGGLWKVRDGDGDGDEGWEMGDGEW